MVSEFEISELKLLFKQYIVNDDEIKKLKNDNNKLKLLRDSIQDELEFSMEDNGVDNIEMKNNDKKITFSKIEKEKYKPATNKKYLNSVCLRLFENDKNKVEKFTKMIQEERKVEVVTELVMKKKD